MKRKLSLDGGTVIPDCLTEVYKNVWIKIPVNFKALAIEEKHRIITALKEYVYQLEVDITLEE